MLESKVENKKYDVDELGFYGEFGGAFIPEMLYPNVEYLRKKYLEIMYESEFQKEFSALLKRLCWKTFSIVFCQKIIKAL